MLSQAERRSQGYLITAFMITMNYASKITIIDLGKNDAIC